MDVDTPEPAQAVDFLPGPSSSHRTPSSSRPTLSAAEQSLLRVSQRPQPVAQPETTVQGRASRDMLLEALRRSVQALQALTAHDEWRDFTEAETDAFRRDLRAADDATSNLQQQVARMRAYLDRVDTSTVGVVFGELVRHEQER